MRTQKNADKNDGEPHKHVPSLVVEPFKENAHPADFLAPST